MPVKWLVLETPVPEEAIVGAARLKHDSSRNGHVDCFCVSSPCSEETKIAVMKRLLSKVETVCYNLGLRSCILEAPQWRTDLEALFSQCGYEERSGHMWPEDRQDQLLKPTMVLEYHKVFPVQGLSQSQQPELLTRPNDAGIYTSNNEAGQGAGLDLGELSIVGEEVEVQAPGAAVASMPQLINNLFAALHAEYGSGANSGASGGEE
jgi:N-acetylglutamate synthase-like GNAT family acetyltransferase